MIHLESDFQHIVLIEVGEAHENRAGVLRIGAIAFFEVVSLKISEVLLRSVQA